MFPLMPFPDIADFALFSLVLGRMAGMFAAIPMFGGKNVPARIKVAATFAMTLLFFPIIKTKMPQIPEDSISMALMMTRETLVGLTFGLLSQAIFSAVEFCGQMIGTQMGYAAASLFDPAMGTQQSLMAVLQDLIAVLFFITLGMHHVFIRAIIESYTLVPIGAWHISGELVKAIIATTTGIFVLALKLMAPVMASIMASTVALGVMSRIFPQMNIFMMSFPLNIGLGLLVLGITMNVFFQTLGGAFAGLSNQINTFLKLMGA